MTKRTVNVKNYERFKNGKWEHVRNYEKKIDVVNLSNQLKDDIMTGKAVRLFAETEEYKEKHKKIPDDQKIDLGSMTDKEFLEFENRFFADPNIEKVTNKAFLDSIAAGEANPEQKEATYEYWFDCFISDEIHSNDIMTYKEFVNKWTSIINLY